MKKQAFTLAEVLITLSILGVVAAISIPNIIQSYKKTYTVTRLKQAYSLLENAISISEVVNGSSLNWDYTLSDFRSKYIYPYLNISYKCTTTEDLRGGKCFAIENGQYLFQTMRGNITSYDGSYYSAARLSNGMSLAIKKDSNYNTGAIFAIDIDGPNKGKSVIGKDVFFFSLSRVNTNQTLFVPGLDNNNRGYFKNKTVEELMGTTINGGCNKNGKQSGSDYVGVQCAAAIIKNNWKIPDNYPVKF